MTTSSPAAPRVGSSAKRSRVFASALVGGALSVDAFNVTVQHELTSTMSVEVAYVGNRGRGFIGDGPAAKGQPRLVGLLQRVGPGLARIRIVGADRMVAVIDNPRGQAWTRRRRRSMAA